MRVLYALLVSAALLVAPASAAKKPKRQLTTEEMQTAYNVSVSNVLDKLMAPSTALFTPFAQTGFDPDGRDQIRVYFYVDSQNAFGAMIRSIVNCWVGPPRKKDGLHHPRCFVTTR